MSDFKIKIKDEEVGMALDSLQGISLLPSFRKWYPDNQSPDNRARYRAKQILARPHVQAYIDYVKSNGDLTDQINEESIKQYLWEVATENKGSSTGLKAALALGKEFGIGTETIVIKEEREYDSILDALFEYSSALDRGEQPTIPDCLNDGYSGTAEHAEFEIITSEIGYEDE